jgi:hypothetical protein
LGAGHQSINLLFSQLNGIPNVGGMTKTPWFDRGNIRAGVKNLLDNQWGYETGGNGCI